MFGLYGELCREDTVYGKKKKCRYLLNLLGTDRVRHVL